MEIVENGDDIEITGRKKSEEEIVERTFRITEGLLEKYGRTEGCSGCEATIIAEYHKLSGSARRHTDECRVRTISQMEGTEDNVRIRRKVRPELDEDMSLEDFCKRGLEDNEVAMPLIKFNLR